MDNATVTDAIDNSVELLKCVSKSLWENPELAYEEHNSHKLLVKALSDSGFSVQPSFMLPTAFRAEYSNGEGPTVCVICEYDALPDIRQACGHNLIAECGLGAAIGIRAALEKGEIKGKVVCLGTPAEENGGGKVDLINKGAFKDIDFCMMAHPGPYNQCYPLILAVHRFDVQYFGKASHAAACPWEGVNALDAAVACYNNIAMLRQQTKPDWRIHGVITHGGTAPNVIPAETRLKFLIRSPRFSDQEVFKQKAVACFEAAAKATGCEMKYNIVKHSYKDLITNKVMIGIFQKHANKFEIEFTDEDENVDRFVASTDMGDVSYEVPSIHPIYHMGTTAPNHTVEFNRCGGLPEAQPYTIKIAKSLALTAVEVMSNKELYKDMKKEFQDLNI